MKHLGDPVCAAEIRTRMTFLRAGDSGQWGSMSVAEMVCHLREAYVGAMDEPKWDRPLSAQLPSPVMRFFALKLPVRWPQNVETVPQLKRGSVVPPAQWEEDRATLDAAFTRFLAFRENRYPHPLFGAMQPWDWQRWGYLHADHHLRQFGR